MEEGSILKFPVCRNQSKGFSLFLIIILVAVLVAAGIGGGLYWKQHLQNLCGLQPPLICGVDNKLICLEKKWRCEKAEEFKKDNQYSSSEAASDAANVEKLPSENDISDWKLYRNEKYGFEVRYPNDYGVGSLCGGMDFSVSPEECSKITIGVSRSQYVDEIMKIQILESAAMSLAEWLQRAKIKPELSFHGSKILSGIQFEEVQFKDYLSFFTNIIGGEPILSSGRGVTLLTQLEDGRLVVISYPLEFCPKDNRDCYSDERNKLYPKILSTFKFIPLEK